MRLIMGKEERFVYNKVIRPGEEFEVPDGEGKLWLKLGIATEVPIRRFSTRTMKGRYNRSDMRAEDETE